MKDNHECDAIKFARKRVKVVSRKKSVLLSDKSIWIIIGIVCFIILSMYFFRHDHADEKQQSQILEIEKNKQELSANLARLKSMSQAMKQDNKALQLMQLNHPQTSKDYIARQNAPTHMYSADSRTLSAINHAMENSQIFSGDGVYSGFGNKTSSAMSVDAKKITHPESTLAQGELMHAVLETAIDSDLPGQIRAVVSQPLYAYTSEQPLIPAGSRLIGQYSSTVFQGQNRVFVIWNRVILPDGITAELNSPGSDVIGRAGQGADSVDRHFLSRFGEAALLSIIGAGVANLDVSTNDQYNSASEYRTAISQSFQQSTQKSLEDSLPTKPTLHIYQGAKINVFVAHDIDFYRVLRERSEENSND
ncbi:MAG: TrbI/VirB10 family protein [Gammaproteobacteria bacterium]